MTIANIRPSTLNGIKQLAKKIHRELDTPHTLALDDASRQAGFENFQHAKRSLHRVQSLYPVFLSIHWLDSAPSNGAASRGAPPSGREILQLNLARPLTEIITKKMASYWRGASGFRIEYEDHLEYRSGVVGQEAARGLLSAEARRLKFMGATGLQPVPSARYSADDFLLHRLPGKDHMSYWLEPTTGAYVWLDEPTGPPFLADTPERRQWIDRNGFKMVSPAWGGLHAPRECAPFLISRDGALLAKISRALARVGHEPGLTPWPHETGRYGDYFISPKRQADAKTRRWQDRPVLWTQ